MIAKVPFKFRDSLVKLIIAGLDYKVSAATDSIFLPPMHGTVTARHQLLLVATKWAYTKEQFPLHRWTAFSWLFEYALSGA